VINLRQPNQSEFEEILFFIHQFELDNRDLKVEQFTAAFLDNELVGFGRIREHESCTEICSLGTLEAFRKKGIGKMVVGELIKRASQELYLVCIIPEFFLPLGFKIVDTFPADILDKINYCTGCLVVEEKYLAMKFKN